MDELFSLYFQRLTAKMSETSIRKIQIASRDGHIIAKSASHHEAIAAAIIKSILQKLDIAALQQILYDNSEEYPVVATPLLMDHELMAIILVEAVNISLGQTTAITVRTSLETYIEHHYALRAVSIEASYEQAIVKELLAARSHDTAEQTVSYKLFKSLKLHGFDLFLLRSVILVELEKRTNEFFNINLDLGYEASEEAFKDKVITVIKANKHLNSQDIVAFWDNDHLVIIKSFLRVDNSGKLYYALDNICEAIRRDLDAAKIFSYRIAYGGIYPHFFDVKKSYVEAKNTIHLGQLFQANAGIYSIDQGLLEHTSYYLSPIIKDKSIQTILASLKKADGTDDAELLFIVEEFVDQCMNLTRTANRLHLHRNTVSQKIERFKQKTGLEPEKSFKDAFLTKMAALSVKYDQRTH